jgi:uncharacterized protein YciI
MDLETFTVVILRRPPDAPELPDEELDALQERHLAHLASLRERGVLLAAGPLRDQPDEAMRGICFFAVGVDEARALMGQDPSVRAGRLAVDVMTWYTPRGGVHFAGSGE